MAGGEEKKCRKAPPSKKQKAVKHSRRKALIRPREAESCIQLDGAKKIRNILKVKRKLVKLQKSKPELRLKEPHNDGYSCSRSIDGPSSALKDSKVDATAVVRKKLHESKADAVSWHKGAAMCDSMRSLLKVNRTMTPISLLKLQTHETLAPTANRPSKSTDFGHQRSTIEKASIALKSCTSSEGNDLDANSIADKLAPLKAKKVTSSSTIHPVTICPVRKLKSEPYPSLFYTKGHERARLNNVPEYCNVVSYPSTVVTMTNNMSTIREHSNLTGGKTRDNSQRDLLQLITNVQKSEKQITSVFASVNNSDTQRDGEEQKAKNKWVLPQNNMAASISLAIVDQFTIDKTSDKSEKVGRNTCETPEETTESPEIFPTVLQTTKCDKKRNWLSYRNDTCHDTEAVHDIDINNMSRDMDRTRLSDQQLSIYARLLWISELDASQAGKQNSTKEWTGLSDRYKRPYINRARQAMAEPSIPSTTAMPTTVRKDANVKPRKRPKGEILGKIKISRRTDECKVVNRTVMKDTDKSTDIVLTVTHAPNALPATVTPPQPVNAPPSKLIEKAEAKRDKHRKSSGNPTHQIKEDYGACQQAQQFYSMPGLMQKLYLERELFECRRLMSKSQCKMMLNEYKDEFSEVRHNFIGVNSLLSTRTQKDNLEVIQRSILYNKLQYYKQQAITTNIYQFPGECPNIQANLHSLVDYVMETGSTPPTSYSTYSSELTLLLDVLDTVPTYPIPEEALSEEVRESESYCRILSSLIDDRSPEMISASSDADSLLSDCELSNILNMSDSTLQLDTET